MEIFISWTLRNLCFRHSFSEGWRKCTQNMQKIYCYFFLSFSLFLFFICFVLFFGRWIIKKNGDVNCSLWIVWSRKLAFSPSESVNLKGTYLFLKEKNKQINKERKKKENNAMAVNDGDNGVTTNAENEFSFCEIDSVAVSDVCFKSFRRFFF